MIARARRIAPFCALVLACAALVALPARPSTAAVTTRTPVMGPPLLNAVQLAAWYHRHKGANTPQIPALGDDVGKLAQIFIDQGRLEGVRGDIAFVQSMLETGWLSFRGSQIIPEANNYAGIFAYNGRGAITSCADEALAAAAFGIPSRCFPSPAHGVRVQIQLLRSYADPSVKGMSGRLIAAPSDRAGQAPLWEYFGGTNCPCGKLIWASAPDYGLYIIRMYSQALTESGLEGACVPYAPASGGTKSGSGYYHVTGDRVVHPFGTAQFHGDPRRLRLNAPLVGGEALPAGSGYWLLGRDGGVFSYGSARFYGSTGGMRLNKPVNGMKRTIDGRGYWLVADDGGVFSFGNARFYGSMGGTPLNKPVLGMERTRSGKGYWLFASDGGIFTFGDAVFYGSLGGRTLPGPILAMARTPSGRGYWMLGADGRVYRFGDARHYGDLRGCANLGLAARLLRTPSGEGYWIATMNGAILPFGDAKRLGFPATVGGPTVALLPAG
jgi:hypothetical protein